jgi:CheY-like chemotaxis protein
MARAKLPTGTVPSRIGRRGKLGGGVPTGRASLSPKRVSVLIVDDDAPSVKLLSVVLEAEGCRVQTASSAEEALARLRTFRPDVIVLDLILPLMSGLLLAESLKSDAVTSKIVLIAVTAFNGRKTERIAAQAGFSAYVRKPIDPASFAKLVFATLENVR